MLRLLRDASQDGELIYKELQFLTVLICYDDASLSLKIVCSLSSDLILIRATAKGVSACILKSRQSTFTFIAQCSIWKIQSALHELGINIEEKLMWPVQCRSW